jgi:phosphoglycerate kinase
MNFSNKNIIIRVDFNVPIKNSKIQDTLRIDKSIPTIKKCLKDNPKRLIIISHLGRPNGKIIDNLSLKILIPYLENILFQKIGFCDLENINENNYQIILMENIRFYPEEEGINTTSDKVEKFRQKLTNLGDIFINDAFGCCHRSHSSIVGINCPIKIPGLLVQSEVKYLKDSINKGKRPILAIIGGAKVNDKIKLLTNLIKKVDNIIIGGGMAFTFLKYYGLDIGASLFDSEGYQLVEEILDSAEKNKTKIYLPIDFKIADKFTNDANIKSIDIVNGIPTNWMGLDIGPKSIDKFINIINISQTIIWNGPMGVFELDNFQEGSFRIAKKLSESTVFGKITIIGGGDTCACVTKFNFQNKFSHLSTGGGASLKLLEGKKLEGLTCLQKN